MTNSQKKQKQKIARFLRVNMARIIQKYWKLYIGKRHHAARMIENYYIHHKFVIL